MPHEFIAKLSIYNLGTGLRSSFCRDFGELLSKREYKTGQNSCSDSHKSVILLVPCVAITVGLSSVCFIKCVGLTADCLFPPYRAATQVSTVYWQGVAVSRRRSVGRNPRLQKTF